MKTREVTLFSGETFTVPQGIQRIDTKATHGWQVRYHGTKFFADGDPEGVGAPKSLRAATSELLRRIATFPAPVVLQRGPSAHKTSDLPAGISGPILTAPRRGSKTRSAVLSVLLPRFGKEPQVKSIYIGSENTYTHQRFRAAVKKAIEMRTEVIEKYESQATKFKRRQGNALRTALREQRRSGG